MWIDNNVKSLANELKTWKLVYSLMHIDTIILEMSVFFSIIQSYSQEHLFLIIFVKSEPLFHLKLAQCHWDKDKK